MNHLKQPGIKALGLCAIIFVCTLFACKKEKNDGMPTNTWLYNGHVFSAKAVYLTTGVFQFDAYINAADDTPIANNVLHIDFAKLPTKDGRLKIVRAPYAADEIRIFTYGSFGSSQGYMSKADSNSSAEVAFLNGKMYLSIKNALLTEFVFNDTASIRLNAMLVTQ